MVMLDKVTHLEVNTPVVMLDKVTHKELHKVTPLEEDQDMNLVSNQFQEDMVVDMEVDMVVDMIQEFILLL